MGQFGTFTVAEAVHLDTVGAGDERLILDLAPGDYEPASVAELVALQHLANSMAWMHPDHDEAGPARELAIMTGLPELMAAQRQEGPGPARELTAATGVAELAPPGPDDGSSPAAGPDPSGPPAATTAPAPVAGDDPSPAAATDISAPDTSAAATRPADPPTTAPAADPEKA